MAPRVAAFDHRLAAIVADPGQIDVGVKFTALLGKLGLSSEALEKLPEFHADDERKMMNIINGNRALRWKIVQRGFWTNNASSLSSWVAELAKWKLDTSLVAQVHCPTLVTAAESDVASSNATDLFDALTCPKSFYQFGKADGADMYGEISNRSMVNRKILDWLDDTLAVAPAT